MKLLRLSLLLYILESTIADWSQDDCQTNEVFVECGFCEGTCNMPIVLNCSTVCRPPRCECQAQTGFVRAHDGACIRLTDCETYIPPYKMDARQLLTRPHVTLKGRNEQNHKMPDQMPYYIHSGSMPSQRPMKPQRLPDQNVTLPNAPSPSTNQNRKQPVLQGPTSTNYGRFGMGNKRPVGLERNRYQGLPPASQIDQVGRPSAQPKNGQPAGTSSLMAEVPAGQTQQYGDEGPQKFSDEKQGQYGEAEGNSGVGASKATSEHSNSEDSFDSETDNNHELYSADVVHMEGDNPDVSEDKESGYDSDQASLKRFHDEKPNANRQNKILSKAHHKEQMGVDRNRKDVHKDDNDDGDKHEHDKNNDEDKENEDVDNNGGERHEDEESASDDSVEVSEKELKKATVVKVKYNNKESKGPHLQQDVLSKDEKNNEELVNMNIKDVNQEKLEEEKLEKQKHRDMAIPNKLIHNQNQKSKLTAKSVIVDQDTSIESTEQLSSLNKEIDGDSEDQDLLSSTLLPNKVRQTDDTNSSTKRGTNSDVSAKDSSKDNEKNPKDNDKTVKHRDDATELQFPLDETTDDVYDEFEDISSNKNDDKSSEKAKNQNMEKMKMMKSGLSSRRTSFGSNSSKTVRDSNANHKNVKNNIKEDEIIRNGTKSTQVSTKDDKLKETVPKSKNSVSFVNERFGRRNMEKEARRDITLVDKQRRKDTIAISEEEKSTESLAVVSGVKSMVKKNDDNVVDDSTDSDHTNQRKNIATSSSDGKNSTTITKASTTKSADSKSEDVGIADSKNETVFTTNKGTIEKSNNTLVDNEKLDDPEDMFDFISGSKQQTKPVGEMPLPPSPQYHVVDSSSIRPPAADIQPPAPSPEPKHYDKLKEKHARSLEVAVEKDDNIDSSAPYGYKIHRSRRFLRLKALPKIQNVKI
ncbi:unnamed protein product [Bursaphelenchus okinawaensis]|uniref:TIL domain-containing protein n=1 Tax=Bursaphelenchus okinawaensis TaxID=465554 RepID=A0A811L9B1_9BILA|nr:unnamed protein product [Bursaphelenchus okinawaensis]CAG9118658.1 unnamed protein product [Bursaphelenchus okinawaensis]